MISHRLVLDERASRTMRLWRWGRVIKCDRDLARSKYTSIFQATLFVLVEYRPVRRILTVLATLHQKLEVIRGLQREPGLNCREYRTADLAAAAQLRRPSYLGRTIKSNLEVAVIACAGQGGSGRRTVLAAEGTKDEPKASHPFLAKLSIDPARNVRRHRWGRRAPHSLYPP